MDAKSRTEAEGPRHQKFGGFNRAFREGHKFSTKALCSVTSADLRRFDYWLPCRLNGTGIGVGRYGAALTKIRLKARRLAKLELRAYDPSGAQPLITFWLDAPPSDEEVVTTLEFPRPVFVSAASFSRLELKANDEAEICWAHQKMALASSDTLELMHHEFEQDYGAFKLWYANGTVERREAQAGNGKSRPTVGYTERLG